MITVSTKELWEIIKPFSTVSTPVQKVTVKLTMEDSYISCVPTDSKTEILIVLSDKKRDELFGCLSEIVEMPPLMVHDLDLRIELGEGLIVPKFTVVGVPIRKQGAGASE